MLDPVILVGDVLERLAELPDESVHCVVTSPPYFGLRDYGTEGQIGLEPTLDAFVEKMVEVFREVRRVLRKDGTVWLNLGDSYVSSPRGNAPGDHSTSSLTNPQRQDAVPRPQVQDQKRVNGEGTAMRPPAVEGLKQKDLMMVPARVALALQADGWWLRSEVVWSKLNPMPESCTDRPTSSHEKVYLLTKCATYFYDADAIREDHSPDGRKKTVHDHATDDSHPNYDNVGNGNERWPNGGRNKRNVWHIATEPYPDAHFATFPTKLVEPCILASTSEKGCCVECGAPWEREVERQFYGNLRSEDNMDGRRDLEVGISRNNFGGQQRMKEYVPPKTLGWQPTCECRQRDFDGAVTAGDAFTPIPCTVLDPFAGSGTTLLVARRHNRASIGIELNPEYAALAAKRLERWWEKPKRTAEEVADGQLSLLDP